jgi:hypothetical protein
MKASRNLPDSRFGSRKQGPESVMMPDSWKSNDTCARSLRDNPIISAHICTQPGAHIGRPELEIELRSVVRRRKLPTLIRFNSDGPAFPLQNRNCRPGNAENARKMVEKGVPAQFFCKTVSQASRRIVTTSAKAELTQSDDIRCSNERSVATVAGSFVRTTIGY